ncbi:MAG: thioredoxin family protein [Armatimonadota bacterium]|nr:thioredoxin family protein [Armatimonadota bacterium]MDR7450836.1 thioredoxin family protein [Armatimonadota bacterium]MDR7465757.1 thioredoxin family protein [Armatimonadota bacterium]MDR7493665.1 thioredoxin family protein [Armatimonadota bacterium]MDR7499086.1 thioredoxin family protein [Armatimonadota bacterium]
MITVEVFGPGCPRCRAAIKVVHEALRVLGMDAHVTEISDPKEMAKARVMFTPAVRINGEIKSTGRVPRVEEMITWLATAAASAKGA